MTPQEGYQPLVGVDAWPSVELSPTWPEFLALLNKERDKANDDAAERALEFALRSAALESGAIEGLYTSSRGVTRTVALQGAMWEAALDEIGPDVRGHFEAQLDALDHVLDLVNQAGQITQVWIRQLHEVTCRTQKTYSVMTDLGAQEQELLHGKYKTTPNHVLREDGVPHMYCPPEDVPAEMAKFIDQLSSTEFASRDPVTQAAYAHHAFVSIHPFADGNGRVARAVASTFLYRAVGIPLVIFSDQQERYWDVLKAADGREPTPLIRFVEDRAIDTMAMISSRLRDATGPQDSPAEALRRLLTAHGGLSFAEVEAVGQRLTNELQVAIGELAAEAALPEIQTSLRPMERKISADFGRPYHALEWGGSFNFQFDCRVPVLMQTEVTPIVGIADRPDERFAYIAIDANRPQAIPLLLRIDDLHPATTKSGNDRIAAWAKHTYEGAIQELLDGIRHALNQKGFDPGT